ncbi:Bacteriophage Mu, GpT [uncultured Caudovirales phage]|jgi:Mu-like prophage major head subunit gpT|uniref:Bacteriophage Mu, GpT n=1 Tax=uncultured Caudovirales phage TaxID=2100421 RepID=A0A6J5NJS1_9CAUD|nr:Bacteriophage Mu, GpT [uncultured Caudovirales phage]CAB4196146.1 Bacteriophage Mu, GpT [uncultured Caudovirales phage]CAB4211073.1 Bacteriophage Mu, GpT [uncultured Caudovirales phage]CAB5226786.1 Bacteriophage Mu, GpT [uncultured Caudovirales phage]
MATPMRSTDFRSIVEPILNEAFDGVYDQRSDEWKQVFREERGIPRNYHEEPVLFGFGAAPELPDGTAVTYQSGGVLFIKRYQYKVYGLAFALTKVLVEDGDHIRIGQTYAKHLAQSLVETKETLAANVLNRAFNGAYAGGDGKSLVATDHPIMSGTFSNQLSTAAALSQTSLEQILIQVRNAVDNNGKRIRLNPTKLVVSPSNVFQAEVLLKSVLRTGTGNNDINPVKSMGLLDGGQANLSRLTSTTAWWVETDAPEGLKLMMRRSLEKSMEGDFETDSMRFKSTERYDLGWTDPRAVYGTPGV